MMIIRDVAGFVVAGRIVYKADCSSHSGKSRGGGLCIFIHSRWCTDVRVIETHCLTDTEYMILSCRPFYLNTVMPKLFKNVKVTMGDKTLLTKFTPAFRRPIKSSLFYILVSQTTWICLLSQHIDH